MAPLAGILLGAAADLIVPSFKKALQTGSADLTGKVIDKVAEKLGVPAGSLPHFEGNENLKGAIIAAEPEVAEILAEHNRAHQLLNESLALDYQKEQWWAWGWRPAWMWMLGFLWVYLIIGEPILKAALLPTLVGIGVSDLLAVSSIFMALYMGGHTAKETLAKRWGSK